MSDSNSRFFQESKSKKVTPTSALDKDMSLMDFVKSELTRGYSLELDEERLAARREKVYTFIKVPGELERLMAYGFFQCADAFLFLFTFLPLRCIIAVYKFLMKICLSCMRGNVTFSGIKGSLKPADKCDLLKFFILGLCVYFFSFIDTSVIYHVIKSQSVIKLYIFFNMLEVGDRLFASFVQDTLDALFLTATELPEKKGRMGTSAHTLLAIASVFGHAVVILLQGTTLSVAINASNRALLTVMMSNNFVELKGAVFKKFDKMNLFQISCSDVRERFHLSVLLLIVSIQTMREYSWEESRFWILFPDCFMVLLAEVGVDWLKHAFITRFNEIHPEVYREYTLSMAYDLVQTKQRRAFSDHSDMVGRRLGFVPLPLAIVLIRVVRPSFKGMLAPNILLALMTYIGIATFRLLNSIILLGKACDLIDQHCQKSPQNSQPSEPTTKVSESVDEILSRFRNATSQPTTRSPSPLRDEVMNTKSPGTEQNKKQGLLGMFPIAKRRSRIACDGSCKYRSYSASHTPRPSVVSETSGLPLPDGDVPNLPTECQSLLMSNSEVSILSVSLNEEMLHANSKSHGLEGAQQASECSLPGTSKHVRKYSLGSNVQKEFTFGHKGKEDEPKDISDTNPDDVIGVVDIVDDRKSPGADSLDDFLPDDLDATLVPINTDERPSKVLTENKENLGLDDDRTSSCEGEETTKKKKKGLSWLLHH